MMKRGGNMGQGRKLSGEIYIEVSGETVPYLNVDENGAVTWLVTKEQQKEYEQAMLKNIGESMSRYDLNDD